MRPGEHKQQLYAAFFDPTQPPHPPTSRRRAKEGEHLRPTARYWPDPYDGPWVLVLLWQVINGRPECVGLTLDSSGTPHLADLVRDVKPKTGTPLTTTTLRALRLSELLAEDRMRTERVEEYGPDVAQAFTARVTQQFEEGLHEGLAAKPRQVGDPGRMRPSTLRRMKLAAEMYREAWEAGESATKVVAERMNISYPAAANLVSRARAAGLLPVKDEMGGRRG